MLRDHVLISLDGRNRLMIYFLLSEYRAGMEASAINQRFRKSLMGCVSRGATHRSHLKPPGIFLVDFWSEMQGFGCDVSPVKDGFRAGRRGLFIMLFLKCRRIVE